MRPPKGFGKNYFTLAAIQATVSQRTIHAQCIAMQPSLHVNFNDDETFDDDPESELLLSVIQENTKAGHCSCHCSRFSAQIIKNQNTPNYDIPQFRRTDSVSSPPYHLFNSHHN